MPRKLKVAYLTYLFGTNALGVGKYSWYLVNELRKFGVQVDVYTPNFLLKSFGPLLFYIKNIFLKVKNYDLVHSNEGAGVFVAHPNMVETYHHNYKQPSDINSLVFSRLEIIQCHKARRIIVPSFRTKENLLSYGYQSKRINVIHHGVDHGLFKPDETQRQLLRRKYGIDNSFVVISVGRLVSHKRHKDIIRVLCKIPNSYFILVGDGEEAYNIEVYAKKKSLRLLRFKHINDELLAGLYNSADVYVHASILEGFGMTVLEAMSCSLPIICYDVADFKGIVNGAGVILKPNDLKGMLNALLTLKEDEVKRQQYRQAALQKSNMFTWAKSAEEHFQVYKEVLGMVEKT